MHYGLVIKPHLGSTAVVGTRSFHSPEGPGLRSDTSPMALVLSIIVRSRGRNVHISRRARRELIDQKNSQTTIEGELFGPSGQEQSMRAACGALLGAMDHGLLACLIPR
jgi:hypothetical protein